MAFTRRAVLVGAGAALGVAGTRAFGPQAPVLDGVPLIVPQGGAAVLNDASLLSETPIFRHIVLRDDPGEVLLAALRAELREAAAAGRPVNLAAARHSMGGQSIPREGHAITFDNGLVEAS
ncbi:MAG: FAD-binding oxidoreductase, partial [Rhodobacteraceae bacterium]|nr:FAD-binding oxidoreductase [Paracoccaceae bacterium]